MKHFLYIAAFALAISLFYTAVGHVLPQLESRPPKTVELVETAAQAMTADELVETGAGVFEANCAQCHKIGRADRCPDMAGMGARAHERAAARPPAGGKKLDDVDYLIESICQPGNHLVEGYANIMPPQGKVLSAGQMIAVVAFMQDQGGTVTVTNAREAALPRLTAFGCVSGEGGGAAAAPVAKEPIGPPEQVFTAFGCVGCHALDKPDRGLGPSLQDVGKRLDTGKLYEALLAPDATMAPGDPPYPAGLMKATLEGNGFYERMTPADYKALVDWLAGHGG